MQNKQPHISVVIVNYKVKEYIANLLNSLQKAQHKFELEIFVVDNASGDNSIPYLKSKFPDVHYIENKENVGFGKANNQAIKQAAGEYTLIINPDTLVSEDTLTVLYQHMKENEKCGAAGCKILNPDGSFAPESRRSVPTIWSALCKVFGLNYLFPKNKLFGEYYLSWLDEDEPSKVPVLSGSFMFWRTNVLNELKGFDERFFMYGEDIDLCYRIQDTGYHIDYVPSTSIIHYKGESTKRGDLRYIRIFNKALYQFFEKHYSSRYSYFFRLFIYISIWVRTILSFLSVNAQRGKYILIDLVILNLSLVLGFIIRYGLQGVNIINPEGIKYLWLNVLISLVYLISGSIFGLFRKETDSISTTLKILSITYAGVVFITFFVRDLAYSRLGLIIGFLLSVLLFVSYKLIRLNINSSGEHNRGKIRHSRVIIVGDADMSADIIAKIHSRPDWNYQVIGHVSVNEEEKPTGNNLGTLPQLQDLVNAYKADQVFFALKSVSYKQMLKEISNFRDRDVLFKLIPDSMDFILGKSNVEYLEAIPLVEVEFDYHRSFNQTLKRVTDIFIAVPAFLLLLICTLPSLMFGKKKLFRINEFRFYKEVAQNKWKNRLRLLGYVISGRLSLVGSPITGSHTSNSVTKGVTGLVQISEKRIQNQDDAESFELYYLQNYSIWMDVDIMIKTIFNGPSPIEVLRNFEKQVK